jgi:ArsR family transcriptional regulator
MNKTTPQVLSDAALAIVASRFKVLSDPTRLRLLHSLEMGEKNVGELVAHTGISQVNVSKHMSILLGAGMVKRRRSGVCVYYLIADDYIFSLCNLMCDRLQVEFAASAATLFHKSSKPRKT